jgi:hypothetical protein
MSISIHGVSTQNNHEKAHFKQRKSGVFPELEVKKGPRVSPWESCSLGNVGNDNNGDLEIRLRSKTDYINEAGDS